jgi:hypothetical protein
MAKATTAQKDSPSQTVAALVEVSELDTLYRDLYLETARELIEGVLPYDAYASLRNGAASLAVVEHHVKAAVRRGDWDRAAELTARMRSIKEAAEQERMSDLGEAIYDRIADVPIDPFSTGFYAFFDRSFDLLERMRSRAIALLTTLENSDASRSNFYARRRKDFDSLKIEPQGDYKKEHLDKADLRSQAMTAVDAGDVSQLEKVIEKLRQQPATAPTSQDTSTTETANEIELGDDLAYSFPGSTLMVAERLGLTPVRTTSRRSFAYLTPFRWQPSFMNLEGKRQAQHEIEHLTYPSETADHQREAIELYLYNPFVNSGGARFEVCLVVEDLLLEDFAEPEPETKMPRTDLLVELGLESRWNLTRKEIEAATLRHGPRIVREILQLDPELFRLVAIPADVYTNLAPERGWGGQEMWTHFDGYLVREGGKLHALAGGDKRFGGSHDVMSFHPSYTSDRVLARFAVIQRKRMMSWQKF